MITRNCDWCDRELVQGSGRTWYLTRVVIDNQSIILMHKKHGNMQVDSCNDCYHEHGEEKISKKAMKVVINLPPHRGFYHNFK